MEKITIVIVGLLVTFLYLYIHNKKRAKHESLKYLQRGLDKLRSRWSYNQATVTDLYKVALDVLSNVTKNTNLTNEQRYNVLHELNELLDIHIYYRIRMMKNSKDFLKHFGFLWAEVAAIPVEDEKYHLVQEVTGMEGKIISLFWNDRDHFLYCVLGEMNYILKLIENDFLLIQKEKKQSSYDSDILYLATKLRQTFIAYLTYHPKNGFAQEMNLAVSKIEKIMDSINNKLNKK